jgi:hypothetical protein
MPWHNAATGQLRARFGGLTRILAGQDMSWLMPVAGDHARHHVVRGGIGVGEVLPVGEGHLAQPGGRE